MPESFRRLTLHLDEFAAQLRVPEPDMGRLEKELQLIKTHVERAAGRERRLAAASKLFDGLATGGDPVEVAIATVRAMISVKQNLEARSFASRLASIPESRETGLICSAIVAVKAKLPVLAGSYLDLVAPETAMRHAAPEWYEVSFKRDSDAALLHFKEHPDSRPGTALAVIRLSLAHGHTAEAELLLRCLLNESGDAAPAEALFMQRYFDQRGHASALTTASIPEAPRIGVWDFSAPDRNLPPASIAGYLDSLAWLACLRWQDNVEVTAADPAVAEMLTRLDPALRWKRGTAAISGTESAQESAPVHLVNLPRYAPTETEIPHPTWTLHHGLFGTRVFGTRQQLSLTAKMRPLFVGLSVENPAELSTAELESLRRLGPVGCSNQASVHMLLSLGIDAFYSGPLVSAISAWTDPSLLKELPASDSTAAFISASDPAARTTVLHQTSNTLRAGDLPGNLSTALSYLSVIAGAGHIGTSEPETAAAAAALGVETEFAGSGESGSRSVGPENAAERTAGLLNTTLRMIAAGEPEEEIYAAWRRNTADLVTASRAGFLRPVTVPKPLFEVTTAIAELHSAKVSLGQAEGAGEVIHIAMASDERLLGQLATAINSLQSTTARPLHIHLLTRGINAEDYSWLATLLPTVGFEFFPCDNLDYGESLSRSSHITVSTLDRLLLPSLLTEVDQVVYLDADLLSVSDIAVLADIVLDQHPIAACTATADWARSGLGHILAVAKRLPPDRSAELIQLVAQRTHLSFDAFNAGVLVLNLKQMRLDGFCENYLGYPSYFGLNDQEVLFCYAGARRRQLQPAWNANPSHSYVSQARIIHWAGPAKPWGELHVPYQGAWLQALEGLRQVAVAGGIPVERLDACVRRRDTIQ